MAELFIKFIMKKTILLLVTFLFLTALMAQERLTTHQQEVQQTVVKFFDAISNRDSISLKNFSTADITLYEYGQVWNIDTLILKTITLIQSADFKRSNSFDFIHTNADKTMAWVSYWLQSIVTKDGKLSTIQWLETVVLVKVKKQWKIQHLHSTLIKRS